MDKQKVVDFILSSFKLRSIVHLQHLTTDYYGQHIALNEFYDSFLTKIDDVSENLLCDSDIKEFLEESFLNSIEPTYYIFNYSKDYVETLNSYEQNVLSDFYLYLEDLENENGYDLNGVKNILDEIQHLIKKTCYMLNLN